MTAFDHLLDALTTGGSPVTGTGRGRMARCPAHDDGHASLSITQGNDRVLVKCQAGCDTDDVLTALNLTRADLFDTPLQSGNGHRPEIIATYDYTDEAGLLLFQVVRFEPKDFRQRKPDGANGWDWKLGDTPRVLYRLPQVLAAAAEHQSVYVVEGEKDVHAIEKAGAVATTCPGGAGKWKPGYTAALIGAEVVVVPDRDTPGRNHAQQVATSLRAAGISVRLFEPATGKDTADHLAAGHTLADLVAEGVAADEPPADVASWLPVDLSSYLDGTFVPVVPTLLARTDGVCLLYPGLVHSLHGESESGKSMVAQHLAAQQIMAGSAVLYIDFEADAAAVAERLLMFGATPEAILELFVYIRPEAAPKSLAEKTAFAQMMCRRYVLAVIDGVTDSIGMYDYASKDNDDVAAWMRKLPKPIARFTGAAVACIDHVTKDSDTRGRFAIGGQHKMAGLSGAGYTVEIVEPLGRGLRGVIVLRVGKDRPGYVRGVSGPMRKSDRTQESARVVIDSRATPERPTVTIEPWLAAVSAERSVRPFRLTGFMERISKVLEQSGGATSSNGIEKLVHGRKDHIASALETLVTEGHVTRTPGANRSQMHSLRRSYRQVDDPLSDRYEEPAEPEYSSAPQVPPSAPGGHTGEDPDQVPPPTPTYVVGVGAPEPLSLSPENTPSAPNSWEPTTLGRHGKATP